MKFEKDAKDSASRLLEADFCFEYIGRNLLQIGLMSGDLIYIRSCTFVPDNRFAIVRDQEENILCRVLKKEICFA